MDLDGLVATNELTRVKSRYCQRLDGKRWDEWRQLFADDMQFFMADHETFELEGPLTTSGDEFVEYVSGLLEHTITAHHVFAPDIEVDGDTATGIWAMTDWLDMPRDGSGMRGIGHYHEQYVRQGDGPWQIRELKLTRIHVEIVASVERDRASWPTPWTRPAM
jgi:hypothetical protein